MDRSDVVDKHVNNLRQARELIPDESKLVFDNITAGGDLLACGFKLVEGISNLMDYYKSQK